MITAVITIPENKIAELRECLENSGGRLEDMQVLWNSACCRLSFDDADSFNQFQRFEQNEFTEAVPSTTL